jgi:hypothetical protein
MPEPTPTLDELMLLPVEELARMVAARDVALLRSQRDLLELGIRMMERIEWAISEAFRKPEG